MIGSRFALITIINWILALASVERRRTIFEQCKLASLSSASADQESKPGISWCSLSVIVMVLMILNTLMWSYPFIYLGAARALPAFVKGVRSGLAPVLVCGLMSIPSQIHHVAYKYVLIVVSTFVPVVVNLVSYARVWVIVRAYRLSRKFEVTTANKKCFDANRHARLAFEREVHAAKLTAGCVIFFFVFNAPAYVVMFLVLMMRFDADLVKTHVPLLLPSAFNSIMLLGPLLNPFVPSLFASMKRAHRHAKFAKEDTVIAMSVRPNNLIHPIIHITPAPPV